MYKFDNDKNVICFYDEQDGKRVIFADWNILQKDILMELCDNGFGEVLGDTVSVSPENIYQLDEIERKMLGLPSEYPYDMYVEANNSTLSQDDFRYKVSFYSFYPGGEVLPCHAQGCFVEVSDMEYMFSKEQFALYRAICEFNSLDSADRSKRVNLVRFADIKNLSQTAAAKLDSYLVDTDVCVPHKIKILVDCENDTLHLSASIDDTESEQFTERFNKKEQVKEAYLLKKKEGKRVHVVFNDEQMEQLRTIKKYDKVAERETIDKIMESPESIFDAEKIDIHEFYSDRVIEKGLYRPKYYSFICPYKSEWIPGIKINDNVNGTKNLFFDKKEKLEELEEKTKEAIKNNKQSIEWDNTLINVKEVLPQIAKLNEQYYSNKKFSPKNIKKTSSDEVLIIEENAEELGYSEHLVTVPKTVAHYDFLTCHSLNPKISLKEHQKEGVAWLQYLYTNKCKGCLLADDMGLGKTLQILYFIEWHRTLNAHSQKMSRQQTVDDFQEQDGFNVVIMSPLAAGMGLNITGANHVIHYSRFWNPAKEQQATDRAYRIGQQKEVSVYYPMSVSKDFKSFDVIIDALLAKKTELADATLFPTMRTEIKQQELYDSLLGEEVKGAEVHYLDANEMDLMDDYKFEAFVAALYKKMGYKTILTSASGDKGIDVLAMNGDVSYAIQVKHSHSNKSMGVDGAYEASSGCKYYSTKLGMNFVPVLLSNSSFTKSTMDFADNVNMMLINRNVLLDMLASYSVSYEDVITCELHRLERV